MPPIDSIRAEFNSERQKGKHFRVEIDEKIRKRYHRSNLGKSGVHKNRRRGFGDKGIGIGPLLDKTDVSETAEEPEDVEKLDNSFDLKHLTPAPLPKDFTNKYYPPGTLLRYYISPARFQDKSLYQNIISCILNLNLVIFGCKHELLILVNIQKQVTRRVEFKPNKAVANQQVIASRPKPRDRVSGLHDIIKQDLFFGAPQIPRTPTNRPVQAKSLNVPDQKKSVGVVLKVPNHLNPGQLPNQVLYKNKPNYSIGQTYSPK